MFPINVSHHLKIFFGQQLVIWMKNRVAFMMSFMENISNILKLIRFSIQNKFKELSALLKQSLGKLIS